MRVATHFLPLWFITACGGARADQDQQSQNTSALVDHVTENALCDADYLAWFPDVPDDAIVNAWTCFNGTINGEITSVCPNADVNRLKGIGLTVECGTSSSAEIVWIYPSN